MLRFYHSILDDADNIHYDDPKIAQTIASISTSLAHSLYKFITNEIYSGTKQANTSYVGSKYYYIRTIIVLKLFKIL